MSSRQKNIALPVLSLCLVAVVAGGFGYWLGSRQSAAHATRAPAAELPARAVLQIRPQAAAAASSTSGPVAPQQVSRSPDMQQLLQGHDFAALYQRARNGPQTGEALYIQAEIFNRCAKRTLPAASGGNPPSMTTPTSPQLTADARRERFMAMLVPGDPLASEKLAAFDKINFDACKGLESLGEFSRAALLELLDKAKAAGNPLAASWALVLEIEGRNSAPGARRTGGYQVTDEDFIAMTRLMETRDPEVVRDLQGLMASSWDQRSLLINGRAVEPRAMHAALGLVACDLGGSCGPDSREVLQACAHRSECGVRTLQDHTFFYVASPSQAQQIEVYRNEILGMLNRGSLSGFTVRQSGPSGATFVFGGRRR